MENSVFLTTRDKAKTRRDPRRAFQPSSSFPLSPSLRIKTEDHSLSSRKDDREVETTSRKEKKKKKKEEGVKEDTYTMQKEREDGDVMSGCKDGRKG